MHGTDILERERERELNGKKKASRTQAHHTFPQPSLGKKSSLIIPTHILFFLITTFAFAVLLHTHTHIHTYIHTNIHTQTQTRTLTQTHTHKLTNGGDEGGIERVVGKPKENAGFAHAAISCR